MADRNRATASVVATLLAAGADTAASTSQSVRKTVTDGYGGSAAGSMLDTASEVDITSSVAQIATEAATLGGSSDVTSGLDSAKLWAWDAWVGALPSLLRPSLGTTGRLHVLASLVPSTAHMVANVKTMRQLRALLARPPPFADRSGAIDFGALDSDHEGALGLTRNDAARYELPATEAPILRSSLYTCAAQYEQASAAAAAIAEDLASGALRLRPGE